MIREWQCETCRTIYAEYVNGCPKCWANGETLSGVRFVRPAELGPAPDGYCPDCGDRLCENDKCHNCESCECDLNEYQKQKNRYMWKEIERQSQIPSPLTDKLEITDERNHYAGGAA